MSCGSRHESFPWKKIPRKSLQAAPRCFPIPYSQPAPNIPVPRKIQPGARASSLPAFALFGIGRRWQQMSRSFPLGWLQPGEFLHPGKFLHPSVVDGPFSRGRGSTGGIGAAPIPGSLAEQFWHHWQHLQDPQLRDTGMNWGMWRDPSLGRCLGMVLELIQDQQGQDKGQQF